MSGLSAQQAAVVDWVKTGRGSAIVVARAGCGKTHLLVRGVIRAIVEHDLGEVAAMAFNKNAGIETKDRIKKLADETGDARFLDWKRVRAGTVHSFGWSTYRYWAKDVELDEHKIVKICDELAAGMCGPRTDFYRVEAGPICKLVSLAKQAAIGFLTGLEDRSAWYDIVEHHAVNDLTDQATVDELVEGAITVLRRSNDMAREVADYDDMIYVPLLKKLRFWPKDWVLIDEAQDTNPARRCIALAMLKPRTGRLIAVGDDRQAIYGFTGADADALDIIRREVNATTFPLTVTYRCPKTVVAEANKFVPDLVAHDTAPEGRVTHTPAVVYEETGVVEQGHAETIARWWFELDAHRPTAQDAALCRNVKPLVETAYAMLAAGVGCRVEGREIGTGLIKLATRWKTIKYLTPLEDKLVDYQEREVAKWQAKGREDRAQAAEDKVQALLSISKSLRDQGKTAIADLVDWIDSLFGDTRDDELPNVFTLSTIHKAKGREWRRVFLLYRNETLPSPYARKPWQLKQEENLEYVADTRAMEELTYVG